ncbi:heterokaryon incompatibility protein-domain-containing protein [Xylariaceae sp. FL0804]|nr:heterokaryon incompatibility protein-domain-containing protein [Xylariaceae sp. FL0804]
MQRGVMSPSEGSVSSVEPGAAHASGFPKASGELEEGRHLQITTRLQKAMTLASNMDHSQSRQMVDNLDLDLQRTAMLCTRCEHLFSNAQTLERLADYYEPPPHCRFRELRIDCSLCRLIKKSLLASSPWNDAEGSSIDQEGLVELVLQYQMLDDSGDDGDAEDDEDEYGTEEEENFLFDRTTPSALSCYLLSSSLVAHLAWYRIPEQVCTAMNIDPASQRAVSHWRQLPGLYSTADYWKDDRFAAGILELIEAEDVTPASGSPDESSAAPGLLLDISQTGLGRIYIRECHHLTTNQYVALSYCWGGPQALVTLRSNLPQHQTEGILVSDLPSTIFEAVQVVSRLGFQYLWIDALCIVQDDEDAKAAEIEKMGDIYARATLVLLASGNNRAVKDGFLSPYDYVSLVSFLLEGQGRIPVCLAPDVQEPPQIDTRGWAYQERHLASRILEFAGARGVLLSSGSTFLKFSTAGTWITDEHTRHEDATTRSLRVMDWHSMVAEYSTRNLSCTEDRLPALAGCASKYAKALEAESAQESKASSDGSTVKEAKITYLAGLWSVHIIDDLLWRKARRSLFFLDHYRSPGWSWISVLDHRPRGERPLGVTNNLGLQLRLGGRTEPQAHLVLHDIELAHASAPFGRVLSGSITLRAKVVRFGAVESARHRESLLAECNYSLTPEQQEGLQCLRLKSGSRWDRHRSGEIENGDGGLLILPVDREGQVRGEDDEGIVTCRRIGAFWIWRGESDGVPMVDWDGVAVTTVRLV